MVLRLFDITLEQIFLQEDVERMLHIFKDKESEPKCIVECVEAAVRAKLTFEVMRIIGVFRRWAICWN